MGSVKTKEKKETGLKKVHSLEELANILARRPKQAELPTKKIKIKKQMRKTFDQIEILAGNIELTGGLLNPVAVNQKKDGTYILMAGERRARAYLFLEEKYQGKAFTRIPSLIFHDVSPETHHLVQALENSYVPVPSAEAAEAFFQGFCAMRKKYRQEGKELTMAHYARGIGRSESSIQDALKFASLEGEIRKYAKKGYISYTNAIQLARVPDKKARVDFLHRSVANRWKENELKERIDAWKLEKINGQMRLLENTVLESPEEKQAGIRQIFGKNIHDACLAWTSWANKYISMLNDQSVPEYYNAVRLQSCSDMLDVIHSVTEQLLEHRRVKTISDNYKGTRIKIVYPQ